MDQSSVIGDWNFQKHFIATWNYFSQAGSQCVSGNAFLQPLVPLSDTHLCCQPVQVFFYLISTTQIFVVKHSHNDCWFNFAGSSRGRFTSSSMTLLMSLMAGLGNRYMWIVFAYSYLYRIACEPNDWKSMLPYFFHVYSSLTHSDLLNHFQTSRLQILFYLSAFA